jgi:hypothetical protein
MAHLRNWLFTNLRVAADGNRLLDQENQCWQQFDSTGGPFGEHVVETYIYYFDAQARPGANTLYLSFWYRCLHVNSSSVNGAFFRICQIRSKNDQPLLDLGIDLNRQTWWWARYTSSSASTLVDWGQDGALIEGEWHHVELKIVADPASGGCELRVDGEVQWSTFTVATTYGTLATPYLDRVRFEDDAGNTPRHRFRRAQHPRTSRWAGRSSNSPGRSRPTPARSSSASTWSAPTAAFSTCSSTTASSGSTRGRHRPAPTGCRPGCCTQARSPVLSGCRGRQSKCCALWPPAMSAGSAS